MSEGRQLSHPEAIDRPAANGRTGFSIAASARALPGDRFSAALAEIVCRSETLGARVVLLFLLEDDTLRLVASRDLPEGISSCAQFPVGEPQPIAEAARRGTLQMASDVELAGGETPLRRLMALVGARGIVAAPLVMDGGVGGVVAWLRPVAEPPGPTEIAATVALVQLYAAALEIERLRERDRGRTAVHEAVRHAALAIGRSLDLPAVLQQITDQVREVLGAELSGLGIIDEEQPGGPFRLWVYSGAAPSAEALIGRHPRPVGLLGAVPAAARPIRVEHAPDDPRFRGIPPGHPEIRAFLGVPILSHGRGVGNLYVANKVDGSAFTDLDEEAAVLLAGHAVVAMENARAHTRLLQETARREQAEAALRESEQRFRRLAENAPDVIFRFRLMEQGQTELEYISPSWERIIGQPVDLWLRDFPRALAHAHPADQEALVALIDPDGPADRALVRWRREDGEEVVTETRRVVIRDESGRPTGIEGITREITAQYRAEAERERLLAELDAQRAWLHEVFERSPVGLILLHADGRRLDFNARAEAILGMKLDPSRGIDQIVGRVCSTDAKVLPLEDLAGWRALHGEESAMGERLFQSPDGRVVPIQTGAAPLRDARGQLVGAVLVFEDLTAAKAAQRMREEWNTVVAHDLRQPVTTILAFASLIRRKPDRVEEVQERADHIRAAAKRLDWMISDLLDVYRWDLGQPPLDLQPTDFAALCRDTAARIAPDMRGHEVVLDLDDGIGELPADAARIEQVLVNLLSNAAKYGAAGTPIQLRLRRAPGAVRLEVTNEGEPIPAAELPQIFDRFHRTTAARQSEQPGLGLGLYLSRRLVEAHGGSLSAESTAGRGTTFRISLPFPDLK